MSRHLSFGLGIAFSFAGILVAYGYHIGEPGKGTIAAGIIGAGLIGPGAVLLGRAIWPPEKE